MQDDPGPDANTAQLPDLDVIRQLSGHTRLSTDDARRRYRLILAALETRTQREVAHAIGCSESNVSQLARRACKALDVARPARVRRRNPTAQPGTEGTP